MAGVAVCARARELDVSRWSLSQGRRNSATRLLSYRVSLLTRSLHIASALGNDADRNGVTASPGDTGDLSVPSGAAAGHRRAGADRRRARPRLPSLPVDVRPVGASFTVARGRSFVSKAVPLLIFVLVLCIHSGLSWAKRRLCDTSRRCVTRHGGGRPSASPPEPPPLGPRSLHPDSPSCELCQLYVASPEVKCRALTNGRAAEPRRRLVSLRRTSALGQARTRPSNASRGRTKRKYLSASLDTVHGAAASWRGGL